MGIPSHYLNATVVRLGFSWKECPIDFTGLNSKVENRVMDSSWEAAFARRNDSK